MSQIDVEKLTQRTTGRSYPCIRIDNPTQCLPVVVQSLEKGETQLVVDLNGVRKCVTRISLSAFNIDKLMRCCGDVIYLQDEGLEEKIETISQYLECIEKQWIS